jgi:NAD(P)-dependent dehydrogenase (short-subunit alcohol dehydrogenase family)
MAGILITGCSSGFGLATALRFAEAGDQVFATVLAAREADTLDRARIEQGLPIVVLELDVTDPRSGKRTVDEILERSGRIDVLVNNAGRVVIAPVEETGDNETRVIFETNFFGALHMMQAVLPAMRMQESGTIVNVSSVSAALPAPFYGIYAATKQALEAVSEALWVELAPFGIRVVIVEPGNYRTKILEHAVPAEQFNESSPYWSEYRGLTQGAREFYGQMAEAERVGDPAEVADAIFDAVRSDDPPLRMTAGTDAELMRQVDREEFASMLRNWVRVDVNEKR